MREKAIIEKIARDKNSTPEEVEKEIREAIREAMATKDPQAQELWKELVPDGKEPSIDAFFDFCVKLMKRRREGLL